MRYRNRGPGPGFHNSYFKSDTLYTIIIRSDSPRPLGIFYTFVVYKVSAGSSHLAVRCIKSECWVKSFSCLHIQGIGDNWIGALGQYV